MKIKGLTFNSLRSRLVFTYLILIIFSVGGLVIWFGLLARLQIIEETEHELELQAVVIASAATEPIEHFIENESTISNFNQSINRLTQNIDARLTLLTPQGQPIYDNAFNLPLIPNQYQQIEVQFALQNKEQHHIRFDQLNQEERLYAAAPVIYEEEMLGIVQLSISTKPMQARIQQSWLTLFTAAIAIIILVIGASLWLANTIVKPLKSIQTAANRLAKGDLNQKLTVTGQDELSDLAHAFNSMTAQLKEMINQQRQFVSNASHELRTPLTNIKLRAEALRDGAKDDPTVADKFLADIENETDHMHYLTQNLLSLSRLDATQTLINTQSFDFAPFLQNLITTFSPMADNKQIQLTLNAPTSLPTITANINQMRQVFTNLLTNALKYTPPQQTITLAAQATPTTIIITLTDTGSGIPPEDFPHIFERFYRVDKARTRTTDPGGTGLGLAIVKSIVELHGGEISIQSKVGAGTTVRLAFPLT